VVNSIFYSVVKFVGILLTSYP